MKLLILLGISVSFLFGIDEVDHEIKSISPFFKEIYPKEQIESFTILKSKCNVCHVKRNRSKIFTLENIDGFSLEINEQVFIKKRMPKGNRIKLSEEERIKLKNWLNTVK
jgi:uncharacterized membrane protein